MHLGLVLLIYSICSERDRTASLQKAVLCMNQPLELLFQCNVLTHVTFDCRFGNIRIFHYYIKTRC